MNTKENKRVSAGSIALMILVGLVLLVAISNATHEPTEQEKLEEGFDQWDGSHVEFTAFLKNTLREPDSYQHIETRYGKYGDDSLTVLTQFRARNIYGGMDIIQAEARVHVNGKFGRLLNMSAE